MTFRLSSHLKISNIESQFVRSKEKNRETLVVVSKERNASDFEFSSGVVAGVGKIVDSSFG